tara:strand:+ start:526 stop:2427 length:1902 start_codon:yes stop_codon:yes gene_type:complete
MKKLKHTRKISLFVCIVLALSNSIYASSDLQRKNYKDAIKYLSKGNYNKYYKYKRSLKDYPLYPYLIYKEIHKSKVDEKKVLKFIKDYDYSYISKKAYINLIYRLSSKGEHNLLLENYRDIGSTELHCIYLRSKIKSGKKNINETDIRRVWLSGKSQPKTCDYVFRWLHRNSLLTNDLVMQRVLLALKRSNYSLGRYLVKYFPKNYKNVGRQLIKVHRNPKKFLLSKRIKSSKHSDMIIEHGLKRISRKSFKSSYSFLKKAKKYYGLSKETQNYMLNSLLTTSLRNNRDDAFNHISSNGYDTSDHKLIFSILDYSIHNQKWDFYIKNFLLIQKEQKSGKKWTYWYAKSLLKLGETESAMEIFKELSKQREYYSFLSSHYTKEKYSINNKPITYDKKQLKIYSEDKNIKLIYELYILGKTKKAKEELIYFFEKNRDKNLNYANKIIQSWGWLHGVIIGYGESGYYDDVEARFPVKYVKIFDSVSKNNFEKSLFYSITRAESAFDRFAISSAGAVGMMQIMPRTAKKVSRSVGYSKINRTKLYNPRINIKIGSHYLKSLINKKKNIVYAIASYNAGPTKVRRWTRGKVVSDDAWIESIPYKETREYVKRVIEYLIIYDWRLNKKNTIRISQLINL